jgi:hypothetical protein
MGSSKVTKSPDEIMNDAGIGNANSQPPTPS